MRRKGMDLAAVVAMFCLFAFDAIGYVYKADPDDFFIKGGNPEVVINNVFPGVTLSTDVNKDFAGFPYVPVSEKVIALGAGNEGDVLYPSVFGHSGINLPDGVCGGCWGFLYAVLRADFTTQPNWVQVDFFGNPAYPSTARLVAYDSSDNIIGLSDALISGSLVTVTVGTGSPISYIRAGATDLTDPLIDELRWTRVIPEPATLALLALGLAGLGFSRRRGPK